MAFDCTFDYTPSIEALSEVLIRNWEYVASNVYSKVIQLINSSRNVDGEALQDYSANYKAWKTKNGYSGTVNLQLTSSMVRSITFSADEKGFEIFLVGEEENKKMIKLNSMKNWKVFEWGSELETALDDALSDLISRYGVGL